MSIELRCSRDLALRLGAIPPMSVDEHRALLTAGQHMLVRDPISAWPLFWPLTPSSAAEPTRSS